MWLILGVILGALPGFHPNLAINFSLPRTALFELVFGSIFSSVIPALLMVPQGEMGAILLPGQREVKKGRMQESISKFLGGALLGAVLFAITYPVYRHVLLIKDLLDKLILPFLIFTASATVLRSRETAKAAFLFFLSGLYGYIILNSQMESNTVLGAHFTAMFGLAGLMMSSRIPQQRIERPRVVLDVPAAVMGFIGGLLISLFPAVTPAQVYTVLLLVSRGAKGLSAAGAMASSSFLLSFQSLTYLGKGRMATVETIRYFPYNDTLIYSIAAFGLLLALSRPLVRLVNRIKDVRGLMMLTVLLGTVMFYRDALPVALFSLLLGLIPYRLGTERIHLMGSLILPTILWYLQ